MVYYKTWDEFQKAGERLYLQNPKKARHTFKYCHEGGLLTLKLTDDVTVVKYRTDNQLDLKRMERFIGNMMKHMASKDD